MKSAQKLFIIVLAGLFTMQTFSLAQNKTLKVLTYNIFKGMEKDSSPGKEVFINWVKNCAPDIVALQEVNGFTQTKLESMARKYGHPYAILLKESGYPVALTSKYPIVNVRKVTDNMHHGFIQARISNLDIIVLHLSPHKYWKRSEEIDLILETLQNPESGKSCLLMGDFNSYSPLDSLHYQDGLLWKQLKTLEKKHQHHENLKNNKIDYSVIQKVLNAGFYDALKLKNKTFISTVPTLAPEYTFLEKQVPLRIDYIFISKYLKKSLLHSSVIKDDFTDYKSDHYPILIELKN